MIRASPPVLNVLGTLDQYGLSIFVVGYTFLWEMEANSESRYSSCPKGYKGNIGKMIHTFKISKRYSYGFNPGIGPFSVDVGLSISTSKSFVTLSTTIQQECCCKI